MWVSAIVKRFGHPLPVELLTLPRYDTVALLVCVPALRQIVRATADNIRDLRDV